MQKINNITTETVVHSHCGQNKTTFSIDVGLHITDVDMMMDEIMKLIQTKCQKTKDFITEFNNDVDEMEEYLKTHPIEQ